MCVIDVLNVGRCTEAFKCMFVFRFDGGAEGGGRGFLNHLPKVMC